jgi:hypothetical protein
MCSGLQLDIDRLFNQKQRFTTAITFSAASVTEGILKLVFKTFIECVRLTTFGRFGFQQMQVSVVVFVVVVAPVVVVSTHVVYE